MFKRLVLILALVGALVACTPGSSPSPSLPGTIQSPSLDASPTGSDEMESPTGSDDLEESESPSSS
jgi:hypothetical protein